MKDRPSTGNHGEMIAAAPPTPSLVRRYDIAEIHKQHSQFVWATLHRMGVREADLPDVLQDVFVVIHRRLPSFDDSCQITSWIYGICRKVAAAYRRRPHLKRELLVDELPSTSLAPTSLVSNAEEELEARQAQAALIEALDGMNVDRRATFVMYEIDGLSGDEIAELLGIPVGTVYSRLHAARRDFESALALDKPKSAGRKR